MSRTSRPETQLARVLEVMRDGEWRTLSQVHLSIMHRWVVFDSEAAISARLRDLRKHGCTVECRRVRSGRNMREYRVSEPARRGDRARLWA